MSELRQRRGAGAAGSSGSAGSGQNAKDDEAKAQMAQEFLEKIQAKKPKPGLSNIAKAAKDELICDPYNLQCMLTLGQAYADDLQWKQCETVLVRGWKRVEEFEDPVSRVEFLALLVTASLINKKFRQAHAVFLDVEKIGSLPAELDASQIASLKCRVYCGVADKEKALKAFHEAISGKELEEAMHYWVACLSDLNKLGLKEVTKSTIMNLTTTEEERTKLDTVEKVTLLTVEFRESQELEAQPSGKKFTYFIVAFCTIIICIILYWAEQRSLKSMGMDR